MFEEKVISIVIPVFKRIINNLMESNKWNEIFQNSTKVILLREYENGSELADKLNILFSEDNMKKVAVATKDMNGFTIIEFIKESLNRFFNDYDADEDDIRKAIELFVDEFKATLKLEYPDIYEQILLNDLGNNIEKIKDNSDSIVCAIQEMNNIEKLVLKIPFIQENWLRNNSKYNIDLDFFDYGENDIDKKIIDAINKRYSVYLKFKTKEEGLYYILRLLKDQFENIDDIYVVENNENWNKIINKCKNKILIPYFYNNNIVPIFGNKTIYILSDDDNIVNKTVIEIPNRIRNNLYEKLNKYVKNSDETNRIINKTNGVFPALKRELFTGTFNKPEWITSNNAILLPALILSSWSENKNDKKFLEELSGKTYNKYIRELQYCINSKDPFIISYIRFTSNEYRITELFTAWYHLIPYITEDYLIILRRIIKEIFNDKNNKLIGEIRQVDSGLYSVSLKKGIVKSLTLMNIYGKDFRINGHSLSSYADAYVSEILNYLNNEEKIVDYAEFFPYLFEAAPDIFITWIEKEIEKQNSAIWQLFINKENSLYGNDGYVYLINALEKALFLNNFVVRSINILEVLAAYPLKSKIINSPSHTLKNVFCAWNNEIAISIEDKIKLLELYTKKDYCNWNVLRDILPSFIGGVYDMLSKPLFLTYEIANQICDKDNINYIYKKYFALAFEFAGTDLKKWGSFFENGTFLIYGYKNIVIGKIKDILKNNNIDDEEKYEFGKIIREFIYRYRYIPNKFINSEDVNDIEKLIFDNIKYNNYLYNYLYAFENGAYHTLYPVPHKVKNDFNLNQKKREDDQLEIIKVIYNKGSNDLFKFLSMITIDDFNIGIIIFRSNSFINFKLLDFLYDNGKYEIFKGYINAIKEARGSNYIFEKLFIDIQNKSIEFRMLVLFSFNIDEVVLKFVQTLPESEQYYYWEKTPVYPDANNSVISVECVKKLLEHNNLGNLYYWIIDSEFEVDIYIEYLIKLLQNQKFISSDENIDYKILKVFEKIYKYDIVDDELLFKIIQLEEVFIEIFCYSYNNIKPQYLYNELTYNPKMSASLLKNIYKSDNDIDEDITEEKENLAKISWKVLHNVKFCPCLNNDDTVELPKLEKWCNEFLDIIKNNGQEEIGLQYLGQFLAHAPANSNYWPNREICYILDYYKNEEIDKGFILEIHNSRSVHIVDSGKSELNLANKYKIYAEKCKLEYPHTANLLNKISDYYN
ncbi:MAG: hypothetical protein DBY32_05035 [Phascolarctobacterium sp.]|nr:MAG: hypothetical protein DBY32_05035 [Phascolarctobacterium sp.]